MKVRKAIRKLAALGTGAVMMGATVVGAMAAADLTNYPAPFVEDGQFNGLIVVGEDAASSDVVGAIDIATSLQYASKTVSQVNVGGSAGAVSLSGDNALIERGGDKLEMGEQLGAVTETMTEADLQMLKSGVLSNDQGTTDYNQYLKFKVDTVTYNGSVVYSEDDKDVVGDFLYFPDNQLMFEYQLEFEEGYESDVNSNNRLEDLEDKNLVVLGTNYNIVKAERSGLALDITLLAGDVTDTLYEGETKTYTVNGKDYEVKLLIVADTASDVKFVVNGEVTDKLEEAETDVLSDGTLIGLRDVMPNEGYEEEGGDLVEFYLGANKVVFNDGRYDDSGYDESSAVEVNNENLEEGHLRVDASNVTATRLKLTNLRYRLNADGGAYDVFIPAGKGLREHLDEPEGLLTGNWDVEYHGFTGPSSSEFKVNPKGDDKYELQFVTQEGLSYTMPYVAIESSTNYWGDDNNRLWFTEGTLAGASPTNFTINKKDYFVVSSGDTNPANTNEENTGYTHVLRYDSVDTSNTQLRFSDLAGGTKEVIYSDSTGLGSLIVGGKTYSVDFDSTTEDIQVDLDGDGAREFAGLDDGSADYEANPDEREARLVLKGGVVVDLGNQRSTADAVNLSATGAVTGAGALLNLTVFQKEFDESATIDESVAFNVTMGTEVDVGAPVFHSPQSGLALYTHDEDDDLSTGMTKWGLKISRRQETNNPDTITVDVPGTQRFAQVFVTSGSNKALSSGTVGASGVVESVQVEKINVGAAKLDSEVKDAFAQNLIVVGGPCANDVAKSVMGVSAENCGEGFSEGKAMLKLYESKGKVALLVAGYGALDTRRAARVLADWEKYADDLNGKEVEVSGTTLTDISVSKPAAKAAAPAEDAE